MVDTVLVQSLPDATPPNDSDLLPLGQGASALGKLTLGDLYAYLIEKLPAVTNGVDGRAVLHGTTEPVPELGNDGDFYIDTTPPGPTLYGPKVLGDWGTAKSLAGTDAYAIAVANGYSDTEAQWANDVVTNATQVASDLAGAEAARDEAINAKADAETAAANAAGAAQALINDAIPEDDPNAGFFTRSTVKIGTLISTAIAALGLGSISTYASTQFPFTADTRAALAAQNHANIRTTYLREVGREGSFVFDPTNISAQVAGGYAYGDTQQGIYILPTSDLTGASGAWVRKDTVIRFSHFGAVGDGVTNDLPALQACSNWFFNDGTVFHSQYVDASGTYLINGTLNWGPSAASAHFMEKWSFGGSLTLLQGQAGVWANMNVQNMKRSHSAIELNLVGYGIGLTSSGIVTYANRKTAIGLTFTNSALGNWDSARARGFWFIGIDLLSTTTLFDDDMSFTNISGYECGSGFPGTRSLEGTWTAGATSGVSASTSQQQTINVSVFPADVRFDTAGNLGAFPSCRVRLNGDPQPYFVYGIDRVAGTATIYPWLRPAALAGTGAFTWCFGGAVRMSGGDSGVIHIGKLYAQGCGNGAMLHSLYGARIDSADVNGCGTAFSISQSPNGTCLGYSLDAIYTENNTEDYVFQNRWGGNAYGYIASSYAPNFAKIWSVGDPTVTGGAIGRGGGTLGSSLPGESGRVTFANNGRHYYYSGNNITVGAAASVTYADQLFLPRVFTQFINSQTVTLSVQDLNINRLFGFAGSTWRYIGTGGKGAPTGTITFVPPAGGTINGGAVNASVSFSVFTGVADFEIRHTDTAQLTWLVHCVSGLGLRASNNLNDVLDIPTARANLGLGSAATLAADTDGTLAANSDSKVATQKATKTYIDGQLIAGTGNNTLNSAVKGTTAGAPGAGAFTPNGAATGCQPWSNAPTGWIGVVRFDDGSAWEKSVCYWNGATLSRSASQVIESSTGAALNLTAAATALLVSDNLEEALRPKGTGRLVRRSWTPLPNNATGTPIGLAAPTTVGTAAAAALATTNFLTEQQRVQYTSAATANAMAGNRYGANGVALVSATAGHGGYMFSARFGASQLPAGPRLFVGMSQSTWDSQTIEPSAWVQNYVVFATDSTDANIQLLTNSAAGGGTKIDTGIPLVANGWYKVLIWNAPGSTTVYALLVRVDTGAIWFGSTNTDVPAAGATPFPQVFCGLNGANTGTAAVLHIGAVEAWG